MLLSFALADRINYLKHENETKQKEIIKYLKEHEEIQLKANAELEEKVKERTAKLIENQNKLIESEKMAAIGVLASRMAHEIQNPLNFVNNFSEVSLDLADELEGQLAGTGDTEAIELLKMNLKKISQHGKSASGIINVLHEHLRLGTAADYFYNDNK
jgi:C4-dicarboxylate-specific signal transduction histidine kinase